MVLGTIIGGWQTANALTGGKLNKWAINTGVGLLGKGLKKIGKEHWIKPIADTADNFSKEVLDSKDEKQSSIQKNISNVTSALRESTKGYSNDPNSNGIVHKKFDATKVKVDRRYL